MVHEKKTNISFCLSFSAGGKFWIFLLILYQTIPPDIVSSRRDHGAVWVEIIVRVGWVPPLPPPLSPPLNRRTGSLSVHTNTVTELRGSPQLVLICLQTPAALKHGTIRRIKIFILEEQRARNGTPGEVLSSGAVRKKVMVGVFILIL